MGLAKKATSMMTNSPEVGRRLAKRCSNEDAKDCDKHRHVQLVCGRASHAQVYPRSLCQAVCEGVSAQKKMDCRNLVMLDVMSVEEMGELKADMLHEQGEMEAFDDVSNEPLVPQMVMKARSEELDYFNTMGL